MRSLGLGACGPGEPRQAGPGRRAGADLSARGRGGESRSPSRHFGVERAKQTSRHLFDSHTGSSGRPLFSMTGPLRWTYDIAEGSKSAKPPGPVFPRGAWQVASYSSVSAVRVVARRSAPHTSTTAMGGPQARITIERLSHVVKREHHASVSVSGLGILSLPLRPLFPNQLVT